MCVNLQKVCGAMVHLDLVLDSAENSHFACFSLVPHSRSAFASCGIPGITIIVSAINETLPRVPLSKKCI